MKIEFKISNSIKWIGVLVKIVSCFLNDKVLRIVLRNFGIGKGQKYSLAKEILILF